MFSIVICSCLNNLERKNYLLKVYSSLRKVFPDVEVLIAFDKTGDEIEGAKCYTHNHGMGHSFNWGIENASNEFIFQMEDDWNIIYDKNNINEETFRDKVFKRIEVIKEYGGIFRFTNLNPLWWNGTFKEMNQNDYKFLEANRCEKKDYYSGYNRYLYCNHPQLKHKDFHKKIGYYTEDCPPATVEIDMCEKFYNSTEPMFLEPFNVFGHIGVIQSR